MDENIHLVLFNEILMLASEHFARFDCDCAPVVFMVIQTPSSLLPREKLPTSVGSVENSARIICSHSWIWECLCSERSMCKGKKLHLFEARQNLSSMRNIFRRNPSISYFNAVIRQYSLCSSCSKSRLKKNGKKRNSEVFLRFIKLINDKIISDLIFSCLS